MKAIILAGGTGSRLAPVTISVSKQLLPVYDKPMIYYPLSCIMLAGINEVLIISNPQDKNLFEKLFSDGSFLGMHIEYAVQKNPDGIAEAFIIGKDFIGNDDVALILGDNIFYGQSFTKILKNSIKMLSDRSVKGVIFAYPVKDPSNYGVVDFDSNGNVKSIEEKPLIPKSNYAVPGIYFYNNEVVSVAEKLKPSSRGELEITDINNHFISQRSLHILALGRGMTWLDTGTYERLLEASNFIATIQKRQGFYVSCIEEIAYNNKWISKKELLCLADKYKTEYGNYLRYIAGE